jgi:hypothetical protein
MPKPTTTKARPDVKRYTTPDGRTLRDVDAALDPTVLDRLNRLRGMFLMSTCAGHPADRPGRRGSGPPAVVFRVPAEVVGWLAGELIATDLPVTVATWRVAPIDLWCQLKLSAFPSPLHDEALTDPNRWLDRLCDHLERLLSQQETVIASAVQAERVRLRLHSEWLDRACDCAGPRRMARSRPPRTAAKASGPV